jgi:hypothetical protein
MHVRGVHIEIMVHIMKLSCNLILLGYKGGRRVS